MILNYLAYHGYVKLDVFSDIGDFFKSIPDTIGSTIINAISTLIGKGLYYIIVKGMLSIVNIFYQFFSVFAGLEKVNYDGKKNYLLNIFFNNSTISNIYWGMAIIGMAMVFGFAILAVIRKSFDIDDKYKKPLSSILRSRFKSIFIMLVLSLCVTAVLNSTNVLMQSVTYLFNNAENMGKKEEIEYTDEQYATMARVLNTVGNYSLSPTSDSRYNINSCYNAIRDDLNTLAQQGVFSGHYKTSDESNNQISNWMTVLQELAAASDLNSDLDMDVYYGTVSKAVNNAMNTLRSNPNLAALPNYKFDLYTVKDAEECVLDRALFIMGTTHAANSDTYNQNASCNDAVRGPFYTGEKSIYDINEVSDTFNIKLNGINYVLIAIIAFFVLKYLFRAIIQCASRIFMMIALYIVAPPFIATMPWDDGEKFRQWTQGFIIQCFGVFGTIIPMRILITLIPIILSDKLTLFANSSLMNMVAKMVLILGGLIAISSFSEVLTGILSGNVGAASAHSNEKAGMVGRQIAGAGAKVAGTAIGAAATVTGLKTVGNKLMEKKEKLDNNWGVPGMLLGAGKDKDKDKDKEKK